MTGLSATSPESFLDGVLTTPAPAAAMTLAGALAEKYPDAAVFLYGSGISVSADENPADILFDYYVVTPDYGDAIPNAVERLAARAIPPNVYYMEIAASGEKLRCKYALLSVGAFEKLVGEGAFHSYFWARFAQPCRLVACPAPLRPRMIAAVRRAIETFLRRSQGLAHDPQDWRAVWLAGLNASYRAELRAENSDRAAKLIVSYGDWPEKVAAFALDPTLRKSSATVLVWRLRALAGALLSVARLLKATATFRGGLDYIAWKVKRHAGVDVAVKQWERDHPFLAAPVVAARYYRLRAAARRQAGAVSTR